MFEPNYDQRELARRAAKSQGHLRVVVIAGWSKPVRKGQGGYWTTLSGKTVVHYPSAYKWPKAYHASTLRVEVGLNWLLAHSGYYSLAQVATLEAYQVMEALR